MKSTFGYHFIFSTKPQDRIRRHLLLWMSWILFSTLIYLPVNMRGVETPDMQVFLLTLIEAICFTIFSHAVFAYLLAYWLIPRFFYTKQFGFFLLGFIGIIIVQAVGAFAVGELVLRHYRAIIKFPFRSHSILLGLLAGVRGGTTIGGFVAAIVIMKNLVKQQEAFGQVQREKLGAELQLLKSQLHPHFLFNTLNNLYALTLKNSPRSPEIVLKLSSLLRYMLYECNAEEVPLEKEIHFLKHYIELEQLRYGDRLDVSLQISGDYTSKNIAPLLLIPFLENSFKHGTSTQLDQAWISLDLYVQDDQLFFKLINSRDAEEMPPGMGGIGLQNVRKRLDLLYPHTHELRCVETEDTFLIILNLALHSSVTRVETESTVSI